MLLVTETDDRGCERILVLPYGSFNSFFTSDEGGSGMTLHVIPGMLIPTKEFERHHDAVREAILGEAAQRMQVSPEEVLQQNLARLKTVTDKEFEDRSVLAARRRGRSRLLGFSR